MAKLKENRVLGPESYPISHLTKSEMQSLRRLMGFSDDWTSDVVRIYRDSPKFIELQAFLVAVGIAAAFRRER